MKIAIIQFPGSMDQQAVKLAVSKAGMEPVDFLWHESLEKLDLMDGYIISNGSSFDHGVRPGIIAALHPVIQFLKQNSANGKPILGMGNGAHILVESGLVPGLEDQKVGMGIMEAEDKTQHSESFSEANQLVTIRLTDDYQRNAFTLHLTPNLFLTVPLASVQSSFIMTEALLAEIKVQGLAVFKFCAADGQVASLTTDLSEEMGNIAAISNKAGNVLAILLSIEKTLHGEAIFTSMQTYMAEKKKDTAASWPLFYYPRSIDIKNYPLKLNTQLRCVETPELNKNALLAQEALQKLGFSVTIKLGHFLELDNEHGTQPDLPFIKLDQNPHLTVRLLVQTHEGLPNKNLASVLWQFESAALSIEEIKKVILKTNIAFNPYTHHAYWLEPKK